MEKVGTVGYVNDDQQYGFITTEDGDTFYVRFSSVKDGAFLQPREDVRFTVKDTKLGREAIDVVKTTSH